MTACFVAQSGYLCVAAADTRLSAYGRGITDWGDILLSDVNGNEIFIPQRYRKIRRVENGWIAFAGSVLVGTAVMDLLSSAKAITWSDVERVLGGPARIEIDRFKEKSVSLEEGSRIFGVVFEEGRHGPWFAQLCNDSFYSLETINPFSMNWPASASNDRAERAQSAFLDTLHSVARPEDIGGVVREAAKLIGAARPAPDCSDYVQIGLTLQYGPLDYQTRYIEGLIDEIVVLSNEQLGERWERFDCSPP